jgi:PilZ domain
MSRETTPTDFAGSLDRRRIARYSCRGLAQITCLPSVGSQFKGRLRDLGLGGCCVENVETTSPFDLGTKTEILIEVDSWIFRAMAMVKALRDRSGISMEFVRMSAGGYNRLADLIADLERPRPVPNVRRPPQPSVWNRIEAGLDRAKPAGFAEVTPASYQSTAIVGTVIPAQPTEEIMSAVRRRWLQRLHPGATSVDVFI